MERESFVFQIPNSESGREMLSRINDFIFSIAAYNVVEERNYSNKYIIISLEIDCDETNRDYVIDFLKYMDNMDCLKSHEEVEQFFLKTELRNMKKSRKDKATQILNEKDIKNKEYREKYEATKRKNSKQIHFYVSNNVADKLNELSSTTGMNKTDIISFLILRGRLNVVDTGKLENSLKQYLIELKEQGNNINQIAYHLNTGRNISKSEADAVNESFQKVQKQYEIIQSQINELLESTHKESY